MAKPRQPRETPSTKAGLKPGKGAPPPQIKKENAGPKRPTEEEDVYGGVERTHTSKVRSEKAKP